MNAEALPSTQPYLLRALHEWCTDNGFTPYLAVKVDGSVQVPPEFVRNGEIVMNVSYDATANLQIGNEYVEFQARFGGVPRQIVVPIHRVMAIYARENGQGMAFTVSEPVLAPPQSARAVPPADGAQRDAAADATDASAPAPEPVAKSGKTAKTAKAPRRKAPLTPLPSRLSSTDGPPATDTADTPEPPKPAPGGKRPSLRLVK